MDTIELIKFYEDRIEYFEKVGIGKETKDYTIVSENLIAQTKKRLKVLQEKVATKRVKPLL